MIATLRELAITVVFAGKGHAVRSPGQQAAVPHQHRGMACPGMGIVGQFRRPLHHLLGRVTVLACQWPPLGSRLWLHTHLFRRARSLCPPGAVSPRGGRTRAPAAGTASPYCTGPVQTGLWAGPGGAAFPAARRLSPGAGLAVAGGLRYSAGDVATKATVGGTRPEAGPAEAGPADAAPQAGAFPRVGYRNGRAPYGVWSVIRVVVDQAWSSSASIDDDVAFLVVRQPGTNDSLQSRTGGERLGFGQPAGQIVNVTGYPNGAAAPISCLNRAARFSPAELEFDCDGYTNGTSGSALLAGVDPRTGLGTVIGVIGGYQEGGDTNSVSYADRLGANVAAMYRLAAGR
jgi:hypothetical protein